MKSLPPLSFEHGHPPSDVERGALAVPGVGWATRTWRRRRLGAHGSVVANAVRLRARRVPLEYDACECARSAFALHNETLNIWTHALGAPRGVGAARRSSARPTFRCAPTSSRARGPARRRPRDGAREREPRARAPTSRLTRTPIAPPRPRGRRGAHRTPHTPPPPPPSRRAGHRARVAFALCGAMPVASALAHTFQRGTARRRCSGGSTSSASGASGSRARRRRPARHVVRTRRVGRVAPRRARRLRRGRVAAAARAASRSSCRCTPSSTGRSRTSASASRSPSSTGRRRARARSAALGARLGARSRRLHRQGHARARALVPGPLRHRRRLAPAWCAGPTLLRRPSRALTATRRPRALSRQHVFTILGPPVPQPTAARISITPRAPPLEPR